MLWTISCTTVIHCNEPCRTLEERNVIFFHPREYSWLRVYNFILQIFYYSSNIFETAGLKKEWIPYANIGTGFINFIVTAIGLQLVKSFGRRPLLIVSCAATSLLLVMLTLSSRYMVRSSSNLSLAIRKSWYDNCRMNIVANRWCVFSPQDCASWVPTVSVVFVLTFVFVYDLGLGPIPYFIGAGGSSIIQRKRVKVRSIR